MVTSEIDSLLFVQGQPPIGVWGVLWVVIVDRHPRASAGPLRHEWNEPQPKRLLLQLPWHLAQIHEQPVHFEDPQQRTLGDDIL